MFLHHYLSVTQPGIVSGHLILKGPTGSHAPYSVRLYVISIRRRFVLRAGGDSGVLYERGVTRGVNLLGVRCWWRRCVTLRQHMTTQRDRNLVTRKLLLTATGTRGKDTSISINKLQLMNMLVFIRGGRATLQAGWAPLRWWIITRLRATSRGPATAWHPTSPQLFADNKSKTNRWKICLAYWSINRI